MKEVTKMVKKSRVVLVSLVVVVILALSIGSVAAAASTNGTSSENGINCGQEAGFGGQGICSDNVCKLLGLTAEEIQAQRQEGKNLVQIAASKGVSEKQLVEAIMTDKKAEIQARVTARTLTQERANVMLQQMEQNIVRAINRVTVGQPEWAGGNGAGQGAGNGQMRNQGQTTPWNCNGESGLGTGSGNMHRGGSR
jgi:hypothetical protein